MKKEKMMRSDLWFWLGILGVLVMLVPYLVLGEDAVVVYHDQLDGEMIAYILQAGQLTGGRLLSLLTGGELAQFMGGMNSTALTPPAPLCVLLFCTGHYFAAYVCMQMLGSLAGYLGMYLLGKEITGRSWVGMVTGILFAYLPFLPVYGLTQYGIPLLIWCFYKTGKGQKVSGCVAYICLYALTSSLVLAGFAVLGLGAVCFLGLSVAQERNGGRTYNVRRLWLAWAAMLLIYIVENTALLGQMFLGAGEAFASHKAEYTLVAEYFISGWVNAFLKGGQHSEDYHSYILAAAAVTFLLLIVLGLKQDEISRRAVVCRGKRLMAVLLACNLLLALAAALWDSAPGIALRSHMEALRGFQLDRVLWVAPAFWYLILVCVLGIWSEMAAAFWTGRRAFAAFTAAVLVCTGLTGITVLKESNLKPNLQKLLNPSYAAITYKDYYAIGVMDQVKQYLTEQTGQSPDEYRVVSLGIDPAAAYYAGFYCLDGYSNNYSLEYKHAFREVIAPELAKSEYLKQYYDGWGNRCYLVSAECPGYYTIEKGGFFFQNYEVDSRALFDMGGRYLLSAAYIQNAEAQGLRLMREEPFETQDSYYRIFLYEIDPDRE